MLPPQSLGQTGWLVSRLGLGLAALGRPGYINLGHADDLSHTYDVNAMQAQAHAVLDTAWAAGVRYFDVARSYGRGEEFLAAWLQQRAIDPNTVAVGSKWGYTYTAAWHVQAQHHEIKDHSLATLQRQWAESQTLLGAHLQLYQIHSATLDSGVLQNRAVLTELARLRATGLKIGLSLSGPHQAATLRQALTVQVDGQRLFDCVQATWNVLEPSAGVALQEAHEHGLGIIVKEALANGRLTARNQEPTFLAKRQVLERLGERWLVGVDAIALAAVLAQPWVDVVLSGASRVEQLTANLQALQVPANALDLDELSTLAEEPNSYWQTRSQLAWN